MYEYSKINYHTLYHTSDINCTHESKDIKGRVRRNKTERQNLSQASRELNERSKAERTEETEVFAIRPPDLGISWFIYTNQSLVARPKNRRGCQNYANAYETRVDRPRDTPTGF